MKFAGDGQTQVANDPGTGKGVVDRRDSSGDRRNGSADRRSASAAVSSPLRPAEIHDACCEWSVPAEKPANVGAGSIRRHQPHADRRS
jgi:hypothetical protein